MVTVFPEIAVTRALPVLVLRARRPGVVQQVHADVVDPVGGAGAVDEDRVADGEAGGGADVKRACADGDVGIGDRVGRSAGGARAGAVNLDEESRGGAGGFQARAGGRAVADAHQHDAAWR